MKKADSKNYTICLCKKCKKYLTLQIAVQIFKTFGDQYELRCKLVQISHNCSTIMGDVMNSAFEGFTYVSSLTNGLDCKVVAKSTCVARDMKICWCLIKWCPV